MPRDYSWHHRKLYHTMLADPDGPAWISSKNDSIQCRQHTMDVWDVIAEESRREKKVMDRGVSFPWAMIRFLSISKGASACVLICTQCIISIGTQIWRPWCVDDIGWNHFLKKSKRDHPDLQASCDKAFGEVDCNPGALQTGTNFHKMQEVRLLTLC